LHALECSRLIQRILGEIRETRDGSCATGGASTDWISTTDRGYAILPG
jgi:hypothetical protein